MTYERANGSVLFDSGMNPVTFIYLPLPKYITPSQYSTFLAGESENWKGLSAVVMCLSLSVCLYQIRLKYFTPYLYSTSLAGEDGLGESIIC